MNNDYILIFFAIFIVTALIYLLYIVMLGSNKSKNDKELQITSNEILEQLNILYKQKKYPIVESLAKNYLQKKAGEDKIRTILTKTLYNSNKTYEAIEQAKILIKHHPDNFEMRIFLANCYLSVEKPMKAIEVYEQILEDDPTDIVAIKELAQIYFKTNQKKSAIKMYKKLEDYLESNHEKAKNKSTIAEIHIEFKEFSLAIEQYKQILDIYPDDVQAKQRLTELYGVTGNYDELITLASTLISDYNNDKNSLWAMTMIMEAYRSKKDYEQALSYAYSVKDHPLSDKFKAGKNIADILYEQGKTEESINILKDLLEQDSDNIELRKALAKSYEQNNDFETASSIYKRIIDVAKAEEIKDIYFEMSSLYSNWAMKLFEDDNIDECFKCFASALKFYEKNPDVYYRLGNVNKAIKNYNEAISQYKNAIEIDPKNSEYYYAISECYENIDSIYEQKKALSESLKYNPTNAKANYKLGIIYDSQNDQNNAMLYIQKAVESDNKFIIAKHKLALMLEHVGNREGAIQQYKDILELEPENEVAKNNLKMLG